MFYESNPEKRYFGKCKSFVTSFIQLKEVLMAQAKMDQICKISKASIHFWNETGLKLSPF